MIKSNVLVASSIYKWLFICALSFVLLSASRKFNHPFHVSVVEINHNKTDKILEITCKIFTDDFEKVLEQNYPVKVDLINPPVKADMDSVVKKYIFSHLSLEADGNPCRLQYLGFERDQEAVYSYVQVVDKPVIKKLVVNNKLMHDLFDDQVNIVHVIVNGKRQSHRLDYPETGFLFQF